MDSSLQARAKSTMIHPEPVPVGGCKLSETKSLAPSLVLFIHMNTMMVVGGSDLQVCRVQSIRRDPPMTVAPHCSHSRVMESKVVRLSSVQAARNQ